MSVGMMQTAQHGRSRVPGRADPRLAATNNGAASNATLLSYGPTNVAVPELIILVAILPRPATGGFTVAVVGSLWSSSNHSGSAKNARVRVRAGSLTGRIIYDSGTVSYTADSSAGHNIQQTPSVTDTPTAGDRVYLLTLESNLGPIFSDSSSLSIVETSRSL